MNNCKVCGGTEFYKEAGYFFCNECQTQLEDKREEILELRLEGTRVTKRKISRNDTSEKTNQVVEWTTWEQYNFVLIGLTDELIELGATSDLKLTVLQLWAFYLGKAEIAFTSTEQRQVPRLARSFHKRDADIIYGKLRSRKRKRSRATSSSSIVSSYASEISSIKDLNRHKRLMIKAEYDRFASSQTGSESDVFSFVSQSLQSVGSNGSRSSVSIEKIKYSKHAKAEAKKVKQLSKKLPLSQRSKYQRGHVTTKYRTGPHVITPMKLWAILYLALRIHNQRIHLADMLRFGREGHLSYYRLDHLLPAEMTLTEGDVKLFTQNNEITHKGMRRISAEIAKFLFVQELSCPDLIPLIERYCKDLNLPHGISSYAAKLIAFSPPQMKFTKCEPLIPNYEGRAMAFIIVVLKVLLRMDGITEYEISRVAEKINRKAKSVDESHPKFFSFRQWQRHIECRRNILMRKHFPTRFKNDPDAFGDTEVYVKFIKSALSRREEKAEIINYKNAIPRNLTNAMERCVTMLGEKSKNSEDVKIFSPSLTPQYSYLEQLLEHPMYDLPDILRYNYSEAKVYYLTKPNKLVKLAAELGIELNIVDSGLHFLNKLVPQFEKLKMPSLAEWNATVTVRSSADEKERNNDDNESLSNYLENKVPQKFELNKIKQSYYDRIQNKLAADNRHNENEISTASFKLRKSDDEFDFGFEDITADGKLLIPCSNYSDSASESPTNSGSNNCINETEETIFYKKYNLQFPHCLKYSSNNDLDEEISQSQNASMSPNENIERTQSFSQRFRNKKSAKSPKLTRDSQGRFVQEHSIAARVEPVVYKSPRKRKPFSKKENSKSTNSEDCDFLIENEEPFFSEVSGDPESDSNFSEKLFVSSTDYWMYHCVFSHVKSKNFEYFETELPVSFQWLLNECADVVEMSTEDLYEQVCLVETYFAHVLKPENVKHRSYDSKNNQIKIRQCKKKW